MKKLITSLSCMTLLSISFASTHQESKTTRLSDKTKHAYQVTKDETVRLAKKSGHAIKSGYEHSKNWISSEWHKHHDKSKQTPNKDSKA